MTISDVYDAKIDEEFPNARTIRSSKYKTSLLYGTKIMVLPLDIYNLLLMYIEVLRPVLTEKYKDEDAALPDSKRYLFVSHKNCGMVESRAITSYLTSTVKQSKVLAGSEQNVSCSRLRTAIATEMAGYQQEDLKTFANCFMMHKESTSRKYYILNFSQREGVRCAMRCMDVFLGNSKSKITSAVEKLMHSEVRNI
jgi:integrase